MDRPICISQKDWNQAKTVGIRKQTKLTNTKKKAKTVEMRKPTKLTNMNQRIIEPENGHMKPDLGAFIHHEMTLTLNTHTPLLT